MIILVINCGSSSIKYQLLDMKSDDVYDLLAKGLVEKIGLPIGCITHKPTGKARMEKELHIADHKVGMQLVLDALVDPEHGVLSSFDDIEAVGHRIVQGADFFSSSALVDEDVINVYGGGGVHFLIYHLGTKDKAWNDKNKGIMMETEHPFTDKVGTDDVRITVHYYEKLFTSSIYSVIHETGHATYEANIDKALEGSFSDSGASMAMHESQSRFYENIVGKNELFLKKHYPFIKSVYKNNLKVVSVENFVRYCNLVEASYIRTEADELTYPIHILIRYEIEKEWRK